MNHYTPEEVGKIYGITARRVKALAINRKVGEKLTNGAWIFHESDIEKLKPGKTGRPKSTRRENENT